MLLYRQIIVFFSLSKEMDDKKKTDLKEERIRSATLRKELENEKDNHKETLKECAQLRIQSKCGKPITMN